MKKADLIKYIVWYATENDIRLTTNRLVKFIYLADLYHARFKNGQTITRFPWAFIYYGPYCGEAMQCIDQLVTEGLINKATYDSHFGDDKKFHLFTCRDEEAENIEEKIHIGVLGYIQEAIRKLGDDTPQLLDYVYFKTEPMEGVKKGEILTFTKAKRHEPTKRITLKKLSPETIKAARQKIKLLSDKMSADRSNLIKDDKEIERYKDDAYYRFVEILDGEELQTGLKGMAKIQVAE